jgi:Holliday junction resolvasome RuvABC DNA-binding subunit
MLDPLYNMDVVEYWFMSNVGEKKAEKIVTKLKNVLDQLYNYYAKSVRGSGDRLSNEEWSYTSSAPVGVGTSNKSNKYALRDFHSFRASKNLMLCRTK